MPDSEKWNYIKGHQVLESEFLPLRQQVVSPEVKNKRPWASQRTCSKADQGRNHISGKPLERSLGCCLVAQIETVGLGATKGRGGGGAGAYMPVREASSPPETSSKVLLPV